MRTKIMTAACVLAFTLQSALPAVAGEPNGPLAVVADTVVVRPVCFVATVLGTAFFVVSLPVAATSKSIKKTAHTLVVKPAKATFTRTLGDLDALEWSSESR